MKLGLDVIFYFAFILQQICDVRMEYPLTFDRSFLPKFVAVWNSHFSSKNYDSKVLKIFLLPK